MAVQKFGIPAETMKLGEQSVYIWRLDNVYYGLGDAPLKCEVRVMTDSKDIIARGEHDGNNYACRQMAKSLK